VDPVLEAASVGSDRFFICPGNHDINRQHVRDNAWEENGLLQSLRSRDDINQFLDKNALGSLKGTIPGPFTRLQHFYNAVWKPLAKGATIESPMLIVRRLALGSASVG